MPKNSTGNGISDEDAMGYATAIHAIDREELILRQDLLRLIRWTVGSNHQTLSEAYAQARTSRTKVTLPFGTDRKLWKSRRESIDQSTFAEALTKRYEVEKDVGGGKRWCPLMRQYYPRSHVKVAHLVPWAIGEINCAYLFGRCVQDGRDTIFQS